MNSGNSPDFVNRQEEHYKSDIKNHNRIETPGSQYIQLLRGEYLIGNWSCGRGKTALDMGAVQALTS